MAKILKAINAIAKSAKDGDEFILIKRADIIGRDEKTGHLLLNKAGEVSDLIRKEDLGAAGYAQDGVDDMGGDGNQEPQAGMSREEGIEHANALQKCRGSIMKAAGLSEEDITAGNGPDEHGDDISGAGDPATKARRAADLKKFVTQDGLKKFGDDLLAAISAKISAQAPADLAPRKGEPGTPVTKRADEIAKTEVEKSVEKLSVLKGERKTLIQKRDGGIPLTPEESLRAKSINDEIARLEVELATVAGASR